MSYEPILLKRLLERAERETYRGHMPGHKGKAVLPQPIERIDFTELCDTGNLYDPDPENVIRQAEEAAASELRDLSPHAPNLEVAYSAGGSTLLIQAALYAVVEESRAREECSTWNISRPAKILAARDAHRSFFSACALLGCEVDFVYPEYSEDGIAVGVSPEALREALRGGEYDAVYITAPNYYGSFCRAEELSEVCDEFGAPLIVDSAHSAHLVAEVAATLADNCSRATLNSSLRGRTELPAISQSETGRSSRPYSCPKFIAIFSAHKTLEAMGGAAFAVGCGEMFEKGRILRGMQLFGSSSPSYAVLASLDMALSRALSEDGRAAFDRLVKRAEALRENVRGMDGVYVPRFSEGEYDPCRLTIGFEGARGESAAEWMERERGVVAEMADDRFVVFILTAADSDEDLGRLERAISDCSENFRGDECSTQNISSELEQPPRPERIVDMREALFAASERVRLEDAEGRISAEILAPYPPGVPVVAPGEKITQKALSFLRTKWYNMNRTVRVLRAEPQNKEDF